LKKKEEKSMTKMQKNDDAKMTTVENAVRHSPILEDVPERDIPFERFLREGGPQFREKLIRSIRSYTPPSNLLDELVYLRWNYFISDEEFLSDYRIFCFLFDGDCLSIFFEDWDDDEDEVCSEDFLINWNLILTAFGSKRMIKRAKEYFDVQSTIDLEQNHRLDNKISKFIEDEEKFIKDEVSYLGIRITELFDELETDEVTGKQLIELENRFMNALTTGNIKENMSSLEDIIEEMENKFLVKDWYGFEWKVMLESIIEFTHSSKSDFKEVCKEMKFIYDDTLEIYNSRNY
tara:strand:- start:5220 stop:6092 length:873 start_codon:yes stop_codon:yes gene_type:complete